MEVPVAETRKTWIVSTRLPGMPGKKHGGPVAGIRETGIPYELCITITMQF